MRPKTLNGAIIVVAGASSGFGRGAALKLAREGATVVIAARRKDMLDDVVAEVETAGGMAVALQTDVSNPSDIARLSQTTISQFGRIDVWVPSPLPRLTTGLREEQRIGVTRAVCHRGDQTSTYTAKKGTYHCGGH